MPSPLPAVAATSDYRLTPGDKLRVEVYKDAQLSQSLQIRPDGKVTLPLLGDIVASELTPIQLRDRIATGLKEYVTNPVVTVIVVEASPVTVYVMGEVNAARRDPDAWNDDRAAGPGDGRRLPRVREHERHPHPAQDLEQGNLGRDHQVQLQRRGQGIHRASLPLPGRHGRRALIEMTPMPTHTVRIRVLTRSVVALGVFALAMLASLPLAAQAPATQSGSSAPGWVFTPGSAVAQTWDNNVLLATEGSGSTGDFLTAISPRAALGFRGRLSTFQLDYRGSYQLYQELSELNAFDQRLNMAYRQRLTPRLSFVAKNSLSQSPTTDEVDIPGVLFRRQGVLMDDLRAGIEARLSKHTTLGS